jgi:superfamily II DNA or RNA helicase
VTVATYESAYRRIAEIGGKFELLIVDECHHFGNGARDEILIMSVARKRLGLTATLPSAEDWLSSLDTLIGPPVFELSVGDLAGTYLADFDCYNLHVSLSPDERFRYEIEMAVYRVAHARFREVCPGGTYLDWVRFAGRTEEGRKALQSFHKSRKILASASAKLELLGMLLRQHWDRKVLIFTADTEVAYRIAREHLIMPITADIGREERERMLLAFKEGRIRALVSCRVLNEGVDVPDAEVAIVLGGTQGPREHIQRIGRILRPSQGKRAIVYELVCRGTSEVRQSVRRSQAVAAPVACAL